jgi:hypothetical protein
VSRRGIEILLVIALAVPCFAGDREFKSVVSTIEANYNTKHVRIPLLGFATFCLHAARTPGTSGLKIAVFDHLNIPADATPNDFERRIAASLGGDWRPVVRVRSQGNGPFTLIFANADENKMKMMIVEMQSDQATVVQVTLKESDIRKWIHDPGNLDSKDKVDE